MPDTNYIIIISIEKYHNSNDFPDVDYANKDAEDFKNSIIHLDTDNNELYYLRNNKATKAAIISHIKKVTRSATEYDRIYLYYSGHGLFENSVNYLTGVDSSKNYISDTCVSIDEILGHLKDSTCQRNILFLDCCHSGFIAGKKTREINITFSADNLKYKYRNEKYYFGFSSCSTDEKSYSFHKLQNGAWTHFLLKALKGEAKYIYENSLLFNDKLQSYLNKKTKEYVKLNTTQKENQTPTTFGSSTDRFIVADLTRVFQKKAEEQTEMIVTEIEKVSLQYSESGRIINLPGFNKKKGHFVPGTYDFYTQSFVKKISSSEIEEEINQYANDIREGLRYKRKQAEPEIDSGLASINTPDFDFIIKIEQSEKENDKFIKTIMVENFKNSDIIFNTKFNSIFDCKFKTIQFNFKKPINLEDIIDKIEDLNNPKIVPIYDSVNITECKIDIKDLPLKIIVRRESLSVETHDLNSPKKLIVIFESAKKELNAKRILKYLIN
jgi:hypothetical protein